MDYSDLASGSLTQLLHGDDLLRKLNELQRQMSEVGEERSKLVASSAAIASGLSIGYVVWLVRGGVLVSSMLSALPAWQLIDPMPVLAAGGARKRGDATRRRTSPKWSACSTASADAQPPAATQNRRDQAEAPKR